MPGVALCVCGSHLHATRSAAAMCVFKCIIAMIRTFNKNKKKKDPSSTASSAQLCTRLCYQLCSREGLRGVDTPCSRLRFVGRSRQGDEPSPGGAGRVTQLAGGNGTIWRRDIRSETAFNSRSRALVSHNGAVVPSNPSTRDDGSICSTLFLKSDGYFLLGAVPNDLWY